MGKVVSSLLVAQLALACADGRSVPNDWVEQEEAEPPQTSPEAPLPRLARMPRPLPELVPALEGQPVTFEPGHTRRLSEVRSVRVAFTATHVAPGTPASVELIGPSGVAYEAHERIVSSDPELIELVVPVAGTTIDTSFLSGDWQARLSINDVLSQTLTFTLLP